MSVDPNGRTALVTGSTSGIDEASAIALAHGAHVLVLGWPTEEVRESR